MIWIGPAGDAATVDIADPQAGLADQSGQAGLEPGQTSKTTRLYCCRPTQNTCAQAPAFWLSIRQSHRADHHHRWRSSWIQRRCRIYGCRWPLVGGGLHQRNQVGKPVRTCLDHPLQGPPMRIYTQHSRLQLSESRRQQYSCSRSLTASSSGHCNAAGSLCIAALRIVQPVLDPEVYSMCMTETQDKFY